MSDKQVLYCPKCGHKEDVRVIIMCVWVCKACKWAWCS